MNLGKNIKKRRNELRLTQQEVATEAGITRSGYAAIEGERCKNVKSGVLIAIAKALECTIDSLVE